jgi:uncharacterized repeat protein (TIGR03806 family)
MLKSFRLILFFLSWLRKNTKPFFMKNYMGLLLIIFVLAGCSNDDSKYQPIANDISVDLATVPYQKLSDYNFFIGEIKNLTPHEDLLLYKPNSELFTDYAKKARYVWLPKNTKAVFVSENDPLHLPVGSVLIKVFYYDQTQLTSEKKIIETRIMIRKDEGWIFANYKWNEEQTEAYLDLNTSTVPLSITHQGQEINFDYVIPSGNNCNTCHSKGDITVPIGIKPIHLNYTLSGINQLQKWIQKGYLNNDLPNEITTVVDYSDTSKSLDKRVRAYFDIQCAHCHNEEGTAFYVSLRFPHHQTENLENMGVCLSPTMQIPEIERGLIVNPQNIDLSTLYYMMNSTLPQYQMPRIGRSTIHQEGVELVEQWINSLNECK